MKTSAEIPKEWNKVTVKIKYHSPSAFCLVQTFTFALCRLSLTRWWLVRLQMVAVLMGVFLICSAGRHFCNFLSIHLMDFMGNRLGRKSSSRAFRWYVGLGVYTRVSRRYGWNGQKSDNVDQKINFGEMVVHVAVLWVSFGSVRGTEGIGKRFGMNRLWFDKVLFFQPYPLPLKPLYCWQFTSKWHHPFIYLIGIVFVLF